MLGLSSLDLQIALSMITSADALTGYEIVSMLGPVEGVIEKSFTAVSVGGIGVVSGGELANMLFDAKELLARVAAEKGANGVVAFRYAIAARELEKSVVVYGTAVKCRRLQS